VCVCVCVCVRERERERERESTRARGGHVTTGRGRGGWEEGLCEGLGEGGIVAAVLVDSVFCLLEEICHGLHRLPHPLAHLYTKTNENKNSSRAAPSYPSRTPIYKTNTRKIRHELHRLSHPLAHRHKNKIRKTNGHGLHRLPHTRTPM